MNPTVSRTLLALGLTSLFLGCGGSQEAPPRPLQTPRVQKGSLVRVHPQETTNLIELRRRWRQTARRLPSVPLGTLQADARAEDLGALAGWVASHGIEYTSTDDQDRDRVYSGRVFLPTFWRRGPHQVPLVVYVHGTEIERDAVPFFIRGSEAVLGALTAYSAGFVVAMPDLPGMGLDRSHRPHHYCHAKALAHCVLDMVRPAVKSLDGTGLAWNGQLFLVGYSEGGYAAMAAVRELQTHPEYRDLRLTGSACMSGPFDLSGSIRSLLSEDSGPFSRPYIQSYLMHAFHDLYPDSDHFHPERAFHPRLLEHRSTGALDDGDIRQWLNGNLDGPAITPKIALRLKGDPQAPLTAREVLNPEWLRTHFGPGSWPDSPVGRILRENDLVGGWVPVAPMFLAASPTDECVPSENTHKMMREWTRLGCRAPVEFYPLTTFRGAGLDHETGGFWALVKAFSWIRLGRWETPAAP